MFRSWLWCRSFSLLPCAATHVVFQHYAAFVSEYDIFTVWWKMWIFLHKTKPLLLVDVTYQLTVPSSCANPQKYALNDWKPKFSKIFYICTLNTKFMFIYLEFWANQWYVWLYWINKQTQSQCPRNIPPSSIKSQAIWRSVVCRMKKGKFVSKAILIYFVLLGICFASICQLQAPDLMVTYRPGW